MQNVTEKSCDYIKKSTLTSSTQTFQIFRIDTQMELCIQGKIFSL